ncbi:O-antigen ligase family protein [Microvirga calopogonii]|uniref:O-antigen ligase family protein n=1 Tax=Microvirga calopogonii TaxID=2078013 RepID=UPI000E0D89B4|nr:O-antigen ligase family protein [Microvirga calopogonii]
METSIPTFPTPIVLGVFLALAPTTILAALRLRDKLAWFLLGAVWLRYLMSALHQYTYSPSLAGLSLNALASVAVAGVGVLMLDKRFLFLKALAGIYLVILVLVASAAVNRYPGAVGSLAKWAYLTALAAITYELFRRHGSTAIFTALLTVFLPPLALQFLSVAMGLGKLSESDGSICFIGGYNHEAAFSIIILTFLYCVCFLEAERPKLAFACMPIVMAALLLANYRTSLLASLPIIATTIFFGTLRRFSPSDRPFLIIVLCLAGATLLYAAGVAMQGRFDDLFTALARSPELIKPPEQYTRAEGELLSARAIIWSRYISAYLNGSLTNYMLGYGPESWEDTFTLYAHNTFVSALYETGSIGLVSIVLLFALLFRLAFRTTRNHRTLIVSAHTGFLLLNLATMPLWMIEGNVLLALTLAYTMYRQAARRHSQVSEQLKTT